MNVEQFATKIIEGPAGMNEFTTREVVAWGVSEKVAASIWTLRCLANPACEGSQEAVDAILERRARLMAEAEA